MVKVSQQHCLGSSVESVTSSSLSDQIMSKFLSGKADNFYEIFKRKGVTLSLPHPKAESHDDAT